MPSRAVTAGALVTVATAVSVPAGMAAARVVRRGIRTSGGVRVGDSEAAVRRRFAHLRVQPAKDVVGGFFLEVSPRGRSDRNRRLIFETDGKTVTYVRAGRLPEVRWVERCG